MLRPPLSGSSISAVRSHNMRALLLGLLRYEPVSRARLTQLTGLSGTTITNLTAELLAQGIIAEENFIPTGEPRSVGRPQVGLRLVPQSRYAVGIHFDVAQVRVAVTDVRGQTLHLRSFPHSPEKTPEAILEEAAALARELTAGIPPKRIVGVGVGASGLVDPAARVNIVAPNLGWSNVPIGDWLTDHLGWPVSMDNNVRAMALGETLFGAGRDVHALAFVYARIGVGAGIAVGGQIYRGSGAGAGEIGHTTMIPHHGERCRCGNTGCLETLVSEPAILRLAYRLADEHPGSLLADYLHNGDDPPLERVFAAARAGDGLTCAMLAERAGYMGIALANLVNVLNPDLIVLGGLLAQGQDVLLPVIEQTMRERAFARLGERVTLQTATFGVQAGVVGAAALALDKFFYRNEMADAALPV